MPRACRATFLLVTLLLASLSPVMAARRSMADQWTSGLKEIDQKLRAGQWKEAAEQSREVAGQMVAGGGKDKDVAYSLAVVAVFRAIAEKGQGNDDEAVWYCDLALSLVPDIGKTDLAPYGAPAAEIKRKLQENKPEPKAARDLEILNAEKVPTANVTRPVVLKQVKPVYPSGLSKLGVPGRFVIEAIIDADGRPKRARFLEGQGGPTMQYAAFDALGQWRFDPARRDGKPVKVYYVLTINFIQKK